MRKPLVYTLRACTRGATALEFALIAPVFFMLFMGTIELALVLFVENVIESSVTNSARLGKTGYTAEGVSREDMIYAMIRDRASFIVDTEQVQIDALSYGQISQIGVEEPYTDSNGNGSHDTGESYTDTNGNGQWDDDMGAAGLGGAGDIVVYTVSYPWHLITPIVSRVLGTNGIYTVQSNIVVRNEPY